MELVNKLRGIYYSCLGSVQAGFAGAAKARVGVGGLVAKK